MFLDHLRSFQHSNAPNGWPVGCTTLPATGGHNDSQRFCDSGRTKAAALHPRGLTREGAGGVGQRQQIEFFGALAHEIELLVFDSV